MKKPPFGGSFKDVYTIKTGRIVNEFQTWLIPPRDWAGEGRKMRMKVCNPVFHRHGKLIRKTDSAIHSYLELGFANWGKSGKMIQCQAATLATESTPR
ncbi:MAG: hypothetical protein R3D34_13880 [Nitratireductor sp.]